MDSPRWIVLLRISMAPVTSATQASDVRPPSLPTSLPPTGVHYYSQMCTHYLSCFRQVCVHGPIRKGPQSC